MCGIAGILGYKPIGEKYQNSIMSMLGRLQHRGPDASGVWVDSSKHVVLGHRRLSILDLSPAGNQPMVSKSGRYIVVFNGEIYNHNKLRRELSPDAFVSTSDTETLLECLEHWGVEGALDRIAGMFAFAVWDCHTNRLILARDRFGEKPLYYAKIDQGTECFVIFSSELKALKAFPEFSASIDLSSVSQFLEFSYIPAPYTIYKNTFKLEAGAYIAFDSTDLSGEVKRYWKAESIYIDHAKTKFEQADGTQLIKGLDAVLQEVITEQMLADVPLGAFLSGGIDSSIIVAMMQKISPSKVKTFTIGYKERGYSEAEHALSVARYLGTEHTELYVTDTMAEAVIPELPYIYDEPFADPSQIPTVLVSQLAGKSVKVALSGDGGDEMFGGYNRYAFTTRYWEKLKRIPPSLQRVVSQVVASIPQDVWDRVGGFLPLTSVGFKIHKAARVLDSSSTSDLYLKLISSFPHDHKLVIGARSRTSLVRDLIGKIDAEPIHQMIILDILSYLPDDILVKVDRAAMSCSLETRAPFLDHRVANYAWSIPLQYKLHDKQTKWILRELLYKYVPKNLVDRPKMGFGFPIDVWLRTGLRGWAESLLSAQRITQEGILDPAPIMAMWNQHLSGKHNWAIQLWPVLMFQAWLEKEKSQ